MHTNPPCSASPHTIVYYGPALAGKTSNFQALHHMLPPEARSDISVQASEIYRMLSMTVRVPTPAGAIVEYRLTTTPGCVLYTRTRTSLLFDAAGVVFILDSQSHKLAENLLSLRELADVLKQRGRSLATFPIVLQYNKRDVPGSLSREQLDHYLNPRPWPVVEAVATKKQGVIETFHLVSSLVTAQEVEQKDVMIHAAAKG